jgi:ABC-type transporter Mla subunit MlaD
MSPTQKAKAKAPRVTHSAHARCEENDRVLSRIADSLDAAQNHLGKLGGTVGSGVNDLRRDVSKALRDARRDVTKMGKATRKDLERMQKDMLAAAKPKPNGAGATKARAGKARAGKATARPSKATARPSSVRSSGARSKSARS